MSRDSSRSSVMPPDGSPPSEAWLFAQIVLGKPIPTIIGPETAARLKRQELETLTGFSTRRSEELRRLETAEAEARHDRELLEWVAQISTEAEDKLRGLQRKEAEERKAWRRAEQFAEQLLEGNWDPSQHPRAPQGQSDGGQWVAKGGGGSSGSAATPAPFRAAADPEVRSTAQLAAFGGAKSSTWPTTGPASSLLPKVGSGARAGAGAAAGIGAGSFIGALRNSTMGAYWGRVPGVKAMPSIWVHELEQRVRAGKLSRDDAIAIFNTAVLGAEAQGFKPIGDRMSLVHKSAVDFLGQAESVYFAKKKKEQGWAVQPGGYQQSGGRVFPTKRNSGLDGYTLRQEQEKFFERGLAEGKLPGQLRGQAAEAGSKRAGGVTSSDGHLIDPEAEAALQRAIRKTTK